MRHRTPGDALSAAAYETAVAVESHGNAAVAPSSGRTVAWHPVLTAPALAPVARFHPGRIGRLKESPGVAGVGPPETHHPAKRWPATTRAGRTSDAWPCARVPYPVVLSN